MQNDKIFFFNSDNEIIVWKLVILFSGYFAYRAAYIKLNSHLA